jgi:hypothetical protein
MVTMEYCSSNIDIEQENSGDYFSQITSLDSFREKYFEKK